MSISVVETINKLVTEVLNIKNKSPIRPVTVLSPNISMIQSINHALLESGNALLNVRVETFYQHVHRIVVPYLINQGIPLLDGDQQNTFIQRVLDTLQLEYFSATSDFPSYVYYFVRAINDVRLNVPQTKLKKSLRNLGKKGEELNRILE